MSELQWLEKYERLARRMLPEINIYHELNEWMTGDMLTEKEISKIPLWQAQLVKGLAEVWIGQLLAAQVWKQQGEEAELDMVDDVAIADEFMALDGITFSITGLEETIRLILLSGLHWAEKLRADFDE
jgi:hypothetical protein